ncbi:berberine bridge enzyme-like 18 isoform X2 [Benincasa hispida]|uniref:berberine bridge enzyme-like 18 isoform X2 n=1 Tax=Benincasa hispida TaxID=102211 RepID=UPI0019023ACF|nr:berberine bridge enzyme-like 18 isoform X2 [Benincasa hispida]
MKYFWSSYYSFISLLLLLSLATLGCWGDNGEDFVHCISLHSSNNNDSNTTLIHTPSSSSYSYVLNFSIRNLRFSEPETPKPVAIITPSHASHVQAAVICCKSHGLQIRTRSGGHDFEGRSYVANVPFVLIDLINLNSITIDTEDESAWVQSGATIGKLYYRIAEKSQTLGFPAGFAPTIGVGGYLSGGGFGMMVRKYGLAVDNVVDAYVVDANGRIFDRHSMGEDLFWAIRGGGGGSFGIVLAWKLKLVPVPPIVTSFALHKTWDQNAADLIHRWQYVAPEVDEDLFITAWVTASNSSKEGGRIMEASFFSLFLGKADKLLSLMQKTFPELGLKKEDCLEMSWIESMAFMASGFVSANNVKLLLDRTPLSNDRYKTKSDYATKPISKTALEGMWERFKIEELETVQLMLIPFGGKMNEISETETPFAYRAGYPIQIGYYVTWQDPDADLRHLKWTQELHDYMTPFVSKSPRGAYINYKDLDIGTNKEDGIPTSYEEAGVWGHPYFGNNFERLVEVKMKVDPFNFFRHEQSIPPAKMASCPDVPHETLPNAMQYL